MTDMVYHPTPWKLTINHELGDDVMRIIDANGDVVMCDKHYYPSVPADKGTWETIITAVNLMTRDNNP